MFIFVFVFVSDQRYFVISDKIGRKDKHSA